MFWFKKKDIPNPIAQQFNVWANRIIDGKVYSCSPTVRWQLATLQQAWLCVETGEVKWIDVPHETTHTSEFFDQ